MTVTTAQLDGWYKRVYGDKLDNAVPEFAVLRKRIAFREAEKIGDSFNFPVKLTRSQGITLNGGSNVGTAFTLNSAISMVTKNATVAGSEFLLREAISYGAIAQSGTGNDESFGPVLDEVPLDMAESANFYLEQQLLYGQTSIATVETGTAASASQTIVVSKATWAAGLWAQMQNAQIDIYNGSTRVNQDGGGVRYSCVVTAVDSDTRTLSVTVGGAITVAVDYVIVPIGGYDNSMAGLDKILTNTGSLFGIDAAVYNLWKANTYAVGGVPATMQKIQAGVTKAVVRGLMEDVSVLMSTYTWSDINNDLAALRRFAESTKTEADIGTQSIKFYGANGSMELLPHPMVKAGEAFAIPFKHFKRVGATDVTFKLTGLKDRFFRELDGQAGIELRNYYNQGLIGLKPARCTKFTGIVNSGL